MITKFTEHDKYKFIGDVLVSDDIREEFLDKNLDYHTIKKIIPISWNDFQKHNYSKYYNKKDDLFILSKWDDKEYGYGCLVYDKSKNHIGGITTSHLNCYEKITKIEEYYNKHPNIVLKIFKKIQYDIINKTYGFEAEKQTGFDMFNIWKEKIPELNIMLSADNYNL